MKNSPLYLSIILTCLLICTLVLGFNSTAIATTNDFSISNAKDSYIQGNYTTTIEAYQKVLEKNPQDINARLNLAVLWQHTDNLHQAIHEYNSILQEVTSLLAKDDIVLLNRGLCYYNLSMLDEAAEKFRQIKDIPFESHLFLGLSLLEKGSATTGIIEIKKAIEIDPYRGYQYLRTHSIYDEDGKNILVYLLEFLMAKGQYRDAYLICCYLKNGNNIPQFSKIMDELRKKLKAGSGRKVGSKQEAVGRRQKETQDMLVIRVGIGTDKQGIPVCRKSVRFSCSGDFEIIGKYSGLKWTGKTNEKFEISQQRDTIQISDLFGMSRIRYREPIIIATEGYIITLDDVHYGVGYLWEGQRECRYRGKIEVSSGLIIINIINLEEYLYGVVPSEIEADAPIECLKAQAVAARSEALHRFEKNRHKGMEYSLCDGQHCQVYNGIWNEDERVKIAVDATRGEVLMFGDVVCDAVFHACCGGHTQDSSGPGWGEVDYLKGVSDSEISFPLTPIQFDRFLKLPHQSSFCSGSQYFRWITYISKNQLEERINKKYEVGEILQIIPLKRSVSGHIFSIKIKGSKQEIVIKREDAIREIFGSEVLYSSLFVIETGFEKNGKIKGFTIFGGGFGHGVGMCQGGAAGMADKGYLYDEILRHYYQGVEVKRQW